MFNKYICAIKLSLSYDTPAAIQVAFLGPQRLHKARPLAGHITPPGTPAPSDLTRCLFNPATSAGMSSIECCLSCSGTKHCCLFCLFKVFLLPFGAAIPSSVPAWIIPGSPRVQDLSGSSVQKKGTADTSPKI